MKKKLITEALPANRGIFKGIRASAAALRHGLSHATEPHILYPAIAVLALAAIWVTTLSLIKDERATAEYTATVSSHQLAKTYEAQVVHALREINQTLMIVKYANDVWEKWPRKSARDPARIPENGNCISAAGSLHPMVAFPALR